MDIRVNALCCLLHLRAFCLGVFLCSTAVQGVESLGSDDLMYSSLAPLTVDHT